MIVMIRGDFLIKIDHHPNDDAYGDLLLVDTSASSASEIVTDWALTLVFPCQMLLLVFSTMVLLAIRGDSSTHLQHLKHYKSLLNFANMTLILHLWLGEWIVFLSKLLNFKAMFSIILKVDENGAARVVLTRKVLDDFNITDAESSAIVGTPGR